ncbi:MULTISPECIES: LPS export ABC transporter periplasmic protein LptC [unclassified Synechococcus]|uniref:LPS export ABC transporter periplasmic protein LptC n=1 Tax=unclassified Synechococcus TaxID=2626047 RepID=UPI0018CEC1CE|nr:MULTISPECIES: LPS export ABC transporter periplasmic protein LptC [unclassified Synechococcus]QPN66330.1 LPS export ABC transporter periplasmic protein LptC [Synechococcus sp. CBW1006]CAK6694463.1 Lipopolysaccharide export system protein LptC [Synechococcus sp. CBW1107]
MSCPPLRLPRRGPRPGWFALLFLPALLVGCAPNLPEQAEDPLPFVFRSLDLRQQDPKGRPAWELRSPEARYDLNRRIARARSPHGLIYAKGKPLYRIEATSGTVLNDGQVIQLEGGVRIQRLGSQPVLIEGERVRWIPSEQLMEIDLRPSATNQETRLVAQRARFLIDQDKLELRGQPELQRWTKAAKGDGKGAGKSEDRRVPPRADDKATATSNGKDGSKAKPTASELAYAIPALATPKRRPDVIIRATTADWYPGSGRLIAIGPLRGTRTLKPGVVQTLTSPALEGNTIQQVLRLQAPVLFEDPTNKSRLRAQATLLDLEKQIASTDLPMEGQFGDLQVRGEALEVQLDKELATIPRGCQLDQPGDSLRAQRCQWNWKTQVIEADGNVVLRRKANDQITRSQKLRGRMGSKGLAVFTTPGARVQTQLTIPKGSGQTTKREPEPIRL